MLKNILIKNSYFDSATLMLLTKKLKDDMNLSTNDISIMMATDMNKRILQDANLLTNKGKNAGSSDLLIAIITDLEENVILDKVNFILYSKKESRKEKKENLTSIDDAIKETDTNFALVSIPGIYAEREVKKLLNNNYNVLLFSDNVSIESENRLKDLAISKNLLMMGPDCGTAIINGVGLGFANKVNRGDIGIIAASGTGLQEISCIISNNGLGISQAYGTGGRDITEYVGGKMMLFSLDKLLNDDNTKKIILVSKPPHESVIKKIIDKVKNTSKQIIAVFLGLDKKILENTNITYAKTLEEAALLAVGKKPIKDNKKLKIPLNSKYIRAIYCGGTLAYETLLLMEKQGFLVYSNLSKKLDKKLKPNDLSKYHTVIDMGDDEFTVGRPHPMIDSTLRSQRLIKDALDEDTAVIIADIELGYGSNDLAADILAEDIKNIKSKRPDLPIIVPLLASKLDYQGYEAKKKLLLEQGAVVVTSNNEAINLAINSVSEVN